MPYNYGYDYGERAIGAIAKEVVENAIDLYEAYREGEIDLSDYTAEQFDIREALAQYIVDVKSTAYDEGRDDGEAYGYDMGREEGEADARSEYEMQLEDALGPLTRSLPLVSTYLVDKWLPAHYSERRLAEDVRVDVEHLQWCYQEVSS